MRNVLLTASLAMGIAVAGAWAEARELKGKWSSGNASTLEILDGKRVKYCFLDQCTTQKYKGDPNGTISFSWGPQHKYEFTRTKAGYRGVYNGDPNMTIEVK